MPVSSLDCRIRGSSLTKQYDFHLEPTWVEGGDESYVLVATGNLGVSTPQDVYIYRVSSFLGVMPGDIVEMAVDVVTNDGLVAYTRSIHKETSGIYDAWDQKGSMIALGTGLKVTITCRVNDRNRDGNLKAFFEGLVRIEVR